jgi:exonuclease III
MNKKDELLNLINDKDYDVIALTEIYPKNIVDSNVSDIEWKIKGYKEFISRSDIATRRGCLVYVKEEIDTIEIESKKFKLKVEIAHKYTITIFYISSLRIG